MSSEEPYKVPREGWAPGPWDQEPDKLFWVDEKTNMPCMVVRNWSGALCGYAGVGPAHPWHGQSYTYVAEHSVQVHGGLTYSDKCQGHLCHDAPEGDQTWWFGFDACHCDDVMPGMQAHVLKMATLFPGSVYRDLAYMQDQCRLLALQLQRVGKRLRRKR